jgi:hypothetical protein
MAADSLVKWPTNKTVSWQKEILHSTISITAQKFISCKFINGKQVNNRLLRRWCSFSLIQKAATGSYSEPVVSSSHPI